MSERRSDEINLLRKRYGALESGPNLDWVLFKEFLLPEGYSSKTTELLVLIPTGYPTTPPDNFYVATGLALSSGASLQSYTVGPSHLGRQWGQFSFHIDGQWRPSADLLKGDNLLTFMLAVEARLKELS